MRDRETELEYDRFFILDDVEKKHFPIYIGIPIKYPLV